METRWVRTSPAGAALRRIRGAVLGWLIVATLTTGDHGFAAVYLHAVNPTAFFVRSEDGLRQVGELVLENDQAAVDAEVRVMFGDKTAVVPLGPLAEGSSKVQVQLPELRDEAPVRFEVVTGRGERAVHEAVWHTGRRWEVYLVPVTHHDLGYTDTMENVLRKYDGFYDDILRFCEETDDWPEAARYRYSVEGAWSILHYLRNCPQESREKLGRYVREGRIEIPALLGNQVGALCSHEELIRLMYPSFQLKRELGAPIRTASITDVPGLSWGLPTVLAGAGIKYFFAGLPGYFDKSPHGFWDPEVVLPRGYPDAFRWEGSDGSSVLVYYQGGYGNLAGGIGPRSYDEVLEHLPPRLEAMEKQGTPFSVVRYIHNGVDNFPPDVVISRIVREWNERWAYPRLHVSTNAMFFEQLERQCKDLRTFRGELPDTDYVVGATATPVETGINRVTHDRLHAAEKFATVASMLAEYPRRTDTDFWITTHGHYPDVNATLNEAYENMLLYDEHTWGMAHPVGKLQDWNWSDKSGFAYRAAGLTQSVLDGSLSALSDAISLEDKGQYVVVFNPLSETRTDVVRVLSKEFGWGRALELTREPFELMDLETGGRVPYQVVRLESPLTPTPYAAHRYARGKYYDVENYELAFVAEGVPPLGWKTYQLLQTDEAPVDGTSLALAGSTMESRFFRLTVDEATGGVCSLYDKAACRELVDSDAPHGLNQFVARWVESGRLEGPERVSIKKGQEGPVYASILVTTSGPGCPQITQQIILYDKVKRVDFANRILKDSTPLLELYFAFPFQVQEPRFLFEGTHSVIQPLRDQFPGSNTNYYAVQHWADVSGPGIGLTLSAIDSHLLEFGGLWPCYVSPPHRGVRPPDFEQPFVTAEDLTRGHMYAFVHDANFRTNFPQVKTGESLFRYAITAHRGNRTPGDAHDFGWAVTNPLIGKFTEGGQAGTLPRTLGFCGIEPASVTLLTLKRAEDGDGLIVRLLETEGRAVRTTLTFPGLDLRGVLRTNLVEENLEELESAAHHVTVSLEPNQTFTLRVRVGEARSENQVETGLCQKATL